MSYPKNNSIFLANLKATFMIHKSSFYFCKPNPSRFMSLLKPSALNNPIPKWTKPWLISLMVLLVAMIMLGGATRLTHSGLSIVDWKPISGILPPLSDLAWQEEFENYQNYPEYQKVNRGMSLSEFKFIFCMEYVHRMLGRLIGFWVFIPFLILTFSRRHGPLIKKSAALVLLVGAQGFLGWYMVKSGLIDNPSVSHYRLAAHLLMALFILGVVVWTYLENFWFSPLEQGGGYQSFKLVCFTFGVMILTITYGAFVAGLKAGLMYNTFPLMYGYFLPPESFDLFPWWRNLLENHATVQFIHRYLAILFLGLVFWLALKQKFSRPALIWLGAVVIQLLLGIITLLNQVPVLWGTLHQGWASVVFAWGVVTFFRSIRELKDDKHKLGRGSYSGHSFNRQ
jgi:cytochrome c oxidase assembly protein subunit 15